MARRIEISTIGPGRLDGEAADTKAVDRMIAHWRTQFEQVLPDRPDLIVVPEFCDQYLQFDYPKYQDFCRKRGPRLLEKFAETARRHHTWITYPTLWPMSDGTWRNCVHLIDRQGQVAGVYHKNFPTFGELDAGICAGREAPVFETELGRVAIALCFDLNFDSLWTHYARQKPDLVIFCSLYHGGLMQAYRAYQCRSHFVGACAGLPCQILNPLGETLGSSTNYHDYATVMVNLDCCVVHIDENQPKYLAMKGKYGTGVSIHDPGLLAAVLISSEDETMAVQQMIQEFSIEPLDNYFSRSEHTIGNHRESSVARRL